MRKKTRFALLAVAVLSLLAAAIYAVYHASQQVPEFYAKELSVPADAQEKDSDLLLQQATTLHNDLHRIGRWQQVFKAQMINAWLAVDLPRKPPHSAGHGNARSPRSYRSAGHHDGLPGRSRRIPRGHVASDRAFVASDDVVGLRVHNARLGAIPWSFRTVLDKIADAAQQTGVDVRWRQAESDPVALIRITSAQGNRKQIIHIDTIRLEEGALVVAGTTEIASK